MSLHSQLQFIEQLLTTGQAAMLGPLEALFVQSHPDPALAHSDLAWLRMRLGRIQEALPWLEKAHAIRPDCLEALDGLCEGHARLADLHGPPHAQTARQWGRKALDAKQAWAMQYNRAANASAATYPNPSPIPSPNAIPTHNATSSVQPHAIAQPGLQVVAFSLFGHEAFYAEAAVRNARDVARHYPGWMCRFYVGPEVCPEVKARLVARGAQVLPPPAAHAHLPGTIWRFLALDDADVRTVLVRDVDSQITEREVAAVNAWLASGAQAHAMRDHLLHSELVLAGLWGAHTQNLRGIGDALSGYFAQPRHPSHADQHFLRDWLWPRVATSVLQHDSVFGWSGAADFPGAPVGPEGHVGHAPTDWVRLDVPDSMADEITYQLRGTLSDANSMLRGTYRARKGPQGYAVRMPSCAIGGVSDSDSQGSIASQLANGSLSIEVLTG